MPDPRTHAITVCGTLAAKPLRSAVVPTRVRFRLYNKRQNVWWVVRLYASAADAERWLGGRRVRVPGCMRDMDAGEAVRRLCDT